MRIYSRVVLAVGSFFLGACSGKLDLYPETYLTEGAYYKNETQFIQAVNDAYRQLDILYDAGGIPDIFGELASDNVYIKAASGADTYPEDINLHQIESNNGKLETAWNNAYSAIYVINNVLDQLQTTDVSFSSQELKSRLGAEAKAIRALFYYNLTQAWGAVPFPLKVVSPSESYSYTRQDLSVIYTQLIQDLGEAKANLPASYSGSDVGRITSYGASAILAWVYLANGDKTKATSELKEIIDGGQFSLDANNDGSVNSTDYGFLFLAATKNSKESILEAQYLAGENQVNSTHQTEYAPWDFAFHLPGSTVTFRGNGLNTPSNDLIAEYEATDPRKGLSLSLGFNDLQTNNFISYPYTLKFYDGNYLYPGQNVEIIRYADILLLYAELTDDPTYLNQVRERVGLPLYGTVAYPQSQFPDLQAAIAHERRVELAFEFHRFFDLRRTGKTSLLFPIPQSAIDTNPAITQNP